MVLDIQIVKREDEVSTPSASTVKVFAVKEGKKTVLKMKTSDGEIVVLATAQKKAE